MFKDTCSPGYQVTAGDVRFGEDEWGSQSSWSAEPWRPHVLRENFPASDDSLDPTGVGNPDPSPG